MRVPSLTFIGLAIAVPLWALVFAGYQQLQCWPSASVPFGFVRLAGAYLLLGMPLAVKLGKTIRQFLPTSSTVRLLLVLAGVVVAVLTVYCPRDQFAALNDPIARHFVRICWVIVLQLPWCVLSQLSESPLSDDSNRLPVIDILIGLLVIGTAPLAYGEHVIKRQSSLYTIAVRDQQVRTAYLISKRLNAYGASSVTRSSEPQLRDLMPDREQRHAEQIAGIYSRLQREIPSNETDDQAIDRAFDWYSLGAFDEAKSIATGLGQSTRRSLCLAMVSEQQGLFAGSCRTLSNNHRLRTTSEYAKSEHAECSVRTSRE